VHGDNKLFEEESLFQKVFFIEIVIMLRMLMQGHGTPTELAN
jgi:hypothetical protein